MKIGILGASGVIGRALVPLLRRQGIYVRAIVSHDEQRPAADEIIYADLLLPRTLPTAFDGLDVVINLSLSTLDGVDEANWGKIRRICIDGSRHLVEALRTENPQCRLIQQSIAMLHQGKYLSDGSGELVGKGMLTSVVLMEATVQTSNLDWVVVRSAAIYGPGTPRDARFFQRITEGRIRPPKQRQRWITFVHIADLATAFLRALNLPGNQAYIASDDRPIRYVDLFRAVRGEGREINDDAPMLRALPSFRVKATRLMETGWQPIHRDVLSANSAPATILERRIIQ